MSLDGALLINKPEGISSFGVIEALEREWARRLGVKRKDLPKVGHGGTLDPFATGLLIVCVGRGVKLSRYFLGSEKGYEGIIRFGETTVPGDPTHPISEKSEVVPDSRERIQAAAFEFTRGDYPQIPPMHSAKKKDGKPLYELARQGVEIEREAKICRIHSFEIPSYDRPRATFRVSCSSGTYIRVLSQDLGRKLGTVAMLDTLHRTRSGKFGIEQSRTLAEICETDPGQWRALPCWIPFDRMLDGYFPRMEAKPEEAQDLFHGKQHVLGRILAGAKMPLSQGQSSTTPEHLAIYDNQSRLIAIAVRENGQWGLERVFPTE